MVKTAYYGWIGGILSIDFVDGGFIMRAEEKTSPRFPWEVPSIHRGAYTYDLEQRPQRPQGEHRGQHPQLPGHQDSFQWQEGGEGGSAAARYPSADGTPARAAQVPRSHQSGDRQVAPQPPSVTTLRSRPFHPWVKGQTINHSRPREGMVVASKITS